VVNAIASVVPRTFREHVLLTIRGLVTRTLGPRGVARLIAPMLFPRPEHHDLRTTFIRQMAENDPRTYQEVSRALLGWSVEDRVAQLACPVLIVAADQDYTPLAAKYALAKRIPGARVVVVSDSHHALPVEKPDEFNAILEEALK
jgi:pimeloyl-ACP methyl ester carboxylesterase